MNVYVEETCTVQCTLYMYCTCTCTLVRGVRDPDTGWQQLQVPLQQFEIVCTIFCSLIIARNEHIR